MGSCHVTQQYCAGFHEFRIQKSKGFENPRIAALASLEAVSTARCLAGVMTSVTSGIQHRSPLVLSTDVQIYTQTQQKTTNIQIYDIHLYGHRFVCTGTWTHDDTRRAPQSSSCCMSSPSNPIHIAIHVKKISTGTPQSSGAGRREKVLWMAGISAMIILDTRKMDEVSLLTDLV